MLQGGRLRHGASSIADIWEQAGPVRSGCRFLARSFREIERRRFTQGRSFLGASCIRLPEVVLYEHIDFGGSSFQTSLNWHFVGGWWNDRISSIIVLGGHWRFYEHWHYQGRYWDLGPGQYRWATPAGITGDTISSFQLISSC
ncbi:MAG: hypothetical protein EOP21_13435 [Hyphomicrobiales bacterium]|nr:MAG: hypothetical protein EOP21_13435 [Hyphomicrobiales bacterium]